MAKVDWSQFTPAESESTKVDWSQFTPAADAPAPAPVEKSFFDRLGDTMNSARDTMLGLGGSGKESVLQGVKMEELEFNPAEAARLSRRNYAEQTVRDERNIGAPSATAAKGKLIALRDDGVLSRAADLVGSQVDAYSAGLGMKAGDALSALGADEAGQTLRNKALNLQDRADLANASVSLNANGAFEKYAPQVLAVFPTMAVAAATGGLPVMFGIAEVQAYAEGRKAGLSPLESLGRAVPVGAAEVIGEKLGGTGKLLDALEGAAVKGFSAESLKNLSGKLLASGAREIPSEEATYLMQFGIDKAPGIGLNQDAGWDEFKQGAIDTAIVAAGAGGVQVGGGAALSAFQKPTPVYNPTDLAESKGFLVPQAAPTVAPRVENQPTTPVAPVVRKPTVADPIKPMDDAGMLAKVPVEGAAAAVDNIGALLGQTQTATPDPVPAGGTEAAGVQPLGSAGTGDTAVQTSTAGSDTNQPAVDAAPAAKQVSAVSNPDFKPQTSYASTTTTLSPAARNLQQRMQARQNTTNGTTDTGTTSLGVDSTSQRAGSLAQPGGERGGPTAFSQRGGDQSGVLAGAVTVGSNSPAQKRGGLVLAATAPRKELLNNQLAVKRHKGVTIQPVEEGRQLTEEQALVSAMAHAQGKTVTWVEHSSGPQNEMPDGWVNGIAGDHMFIDINSSKPLLEIVMHEGTHALPDHIRVKLRRFVNARVSQEGKDAFLTKYKYDQDGPARQDEEVLAYVSQLVTRKPEFIQDLKAALGNKDFAELARVLLTKMKAWLGKGDSELDRTFLDKHVSDLQGVHNELVKAYTQAMQEQGLQPDAGLAEPVFATKPIAVGDYQTVQNKDGSMTVKGDVDEIRALLPDGIQGRATKDGVAFTNSDAPRVRHALEGNNTAYSRGGQVTEKLALTKDGKYLGAPEAFNTPGKIPTLRKLLMKLTKEGEAGRFWYENSSKAVLHMVGGDKVEARKFAALLAIYSPQAKVDTNGTFALRAWAQYKVGQPILVKTGVMDRKAQAALDNVDEFWSGEKTGNFVTNLLRNIDPELAQGATIDMWMMRAAQYSTDAPTKTQYAFMENETNRIARELGWEPQQVQAAIWVAMKARMENEGVKKAVEAKSEKKGWIHYAYPLKNGKPQKTRVIDNEALHRDNWIAQAMAYDPSTNDTQRAKFDFEDSLLRHIGQISFEARPGRTSGVLPGIHNAPYELQLQFQADVQKALYDDDGADMLAAKLGLMVYKETNVPGVWQGEVSPSTQKSVAMAPAKGDAGKVEVDEAQKKALNVYAAVLGLLTKQEGVGWHRPFYATSKEKANGVDINMSRPVTADETAALEKAVGAWMAENGKSTFVNWKGQTVPWSQGLAFVSSPNGIRLINFGVISNAQLHGDLLKAVDSLFPAGSGVRSFKSDGDMPENNWKDQPNGQSYISRISAEGRSDVLGWARTVLGERIQGVFDRYSIEQGWGDPGTIAFSNKSDGGRAGDQSGQADDAGAQEPKRTATQSREEGLTRLPGYPTTKAHEGPDANLVAVAEKYARSAGIDFKRQSEYAEVDVARAERIAAAYAAMPHAPQDPKVKEAYGNLIKQTVAQYKALEKAGYKFWLYDGDTDPYDTNPWNAMRDLRNNQSMGVFSTVSGFGSDETFDPASNPLLEDTGIKWPFGSADGPLRPVLANDLFRAVHDAFGHGLEGTGFRPQGEENAWQAHRRLFTGSALGAITSETRGQNSWLNYGPHGEKNRTAGLFDTTFADQKTGLMPEWTWAEGVVGSEGDLDLDQDIELTIPLDNGKTAKLTVNAQTYIKQLDARQSALEMVKECMV